MSKQVLDIEQMKHLQELGLELGDTILYWGRCNDHNPRAATHYGKWILLKGNIGQTVGFLKWEFIPAYILQDVLDLLPDEIKIGDERCWLCIDLADQWIYYYSEFVSAPYHEKIFYFRNGKELIDAAYEMLCWCIENGHVETRKHDKS